DVLKQGLGKTESFFKPRAWLLVDQLGIEQEIELAANPRRVARDRAQECGIEARADDGGLVGEGARRARQPIEPAGQNALDVEWNLSLTAVRERAPARALTNQRAVLDQAADDLLEEERVTARALHNPLAQPWWQGGATKQSIDQRITRWNLQGRQP